MNFWHYLILMISGTVLSWLAALMVVFYLDPTESFWIPVFFYCSGWLALLGAFTLFGLGARVLVFRREILLRQVRLSFRQALWYASLIMAALFLQQQHLLTWWNIFLMLSAIGLLEYFFLHERSRRSRM